MNPAALLKIMYAPCAYAHPEHRSIDGVGLAREIRSRYPNLPVVLTTGYSDAAQAAPADLKILRKPFDTVALRSFIADMMAVDLAS